MDSLNWMPIWIVSLSEGSYGSQSLTDCWLSLSLLLLIKKMLIIGTFKPWTVVYTVMLKCSKKLDRSWMTDGSWGIINSLIKMNLLWAWSFQVALWTLGQLVASTGYVVEPYRKYPTLLEVLLNFLKTEQNQGTRREVWTWSYHTTISKSFLGKELSNQCVCIDSAGEGGESSSLWLIKVQ